MPEVTVENLIELCIAGVALNTTVTAFLTAFIRKVAIEADKPLRKDLDDLKQRYEKHLVELHEVQS